MIKRGDIILVPFPFSDQSGQKVRPVLVVSNDHYNNSCDDLIVCGITSRLITSRRGFIWNSRLDRHPILPSSLIRCTRNSWLSDWHQREYFLLAHLIYEVKSQRMLINLRSWIWCGKKVAEGAFWPKTCAAASFSAPGKRKTPW